MSHSAAPSCSFVSSGGVLTFHGLLSVEIISHALNSVVEPLDLADDQGEVLQDQAARDLRILPVELLNVVANGAADVDQECRALLVLEAVNQVLLDREEAGVHPRRATLVVSAHVVVELHAIRGVSLQVLEEVELGVERRLVGTIGDVVGLSPVDLVLILVEVVKGSKATSSPGEVLSAEAPKR